MRRQKPYRRLPFTIPHYIGLRAAAKKRRMELEEEDLLVDRISSLPDGVLGDVVSLLPIKAGARTQVLSSRWRHIWRSAPLNLDLHDPVGRRIHTDEITHVLSTHRGPGRRFSIPKAYFIHASHAAGLDRWLQSPALENLQELEFNLNRGVQRWSSQQIPQVPLPPSVYRFSSSLRVVSFGCCIMPDGNNATALRLPVLKQMTLYNVDISESSLHALLAGCTVLQSLLLYNNYGFSRLQIVSPSLRSIGVCSCRSTIKLQLVIKDTPCLERLLIFEGKVINISLISVPRLGILGKLFDRTTHPGRQFQSTIFQGSSPISTLNMVHSVKVLALSEGELSWDAVIEILKCFPHLEKLNIKATRVPVDRVWYHKYQKPIGTHDIRLRKIVLTNYQGTKANINFAKFFVSNARVLESMTLELEALNFNKAWIARQRNLLDIKKRASRPARITFVSRKPWFGTFDLLHVEQVHDLSIDSFERFQY